ncbi:hypothetical protein BDZ97DRAFT_1921539 [Flammula alnicola]|nr:hypothetical protein BDZ97DRAFT_1921539 [Flammula alnicola]
MSSQIILSAVFDLLCPAGNTPAAATVLLTSVIRLRNGPEHVLRSPPGASGSGTGL